MALWSPETGIVDWAEVTRSYGSNFTKSGGKIYLNFCVNQFKLNPDSATHPVLICSNEKVRETTFTNYNSKEVNLFHL